MSFEGHAAKPWQVRLLAEVADITLGGTPSTEVAGFWGGDIPWMASGEVNKRHVFEVDGRITNAGLAASNATLVDPPSVAIGLAGQGKTRGTAALVHMRVCTNQSIALIKGESGILDTQFLFHNLESRYEELRARSAGGGRAGLSREILQKVPISLPDFLEQCRIAAVLDAVDDAIAKTEVVIAKLRQVRAGLLHDLLARDLGEQREVCLATIAEIRFSSVDKVSRSGEEPVHLCNYTDVYNNDYLTADTEFMWATATHAEILQCGLRVGDVIITKDSETPDDIAVPAVVDSTAPDLVCGYHLALIRPDATVVDPAFLAMQLGHHRMARYFGQQANGSTRYGLSIAAIANAPIRLPEFAHQQAASQSVRIQDKAIAQGEAMMAKLVSLKCGLMTDLLTGRVRVPESLFGTEGTA